MTKLKRPYDCNHEYEIVSMGSDNFPRDPDKWSILLGGEYVSLHGPMGIGHITMPTEQFREICNWFMRPQKVKS